MIDSFSKRRIIVSDDGDAGPYIIVQLDQLDAIKKILDEARFGYSVEEDAISLNDQPYTAVVNLGHGADVGTIQGLLDAHEDPKMRRPRSGRHG